MIKRNKMKRLQELVKMSSPRQRTKNEGMEKGNETAKEEAKTNDRLTLKYATIPEKFLVVHFEELFKETNIPFTVVFLVAQLCVVLNEIMVPTTLPFSSHSACAELADCIYTECV